jgi:putative nucleotidyltransferase with HDIG domain
LFERQLKAGKIKASPSGEEDTGHVPLPLRNLVVGMPVPFDVFLKVKSQGQMTPQLMPCCAAGEEFHRDWYLKLNRLQIPHVYFSSAELGQVTAYVQNHLQQALADKKHTEVEKATLACDAAQLWNQHFFTSEQARTGEQVKRALGFLDHLSEMLQKDRNNLMVLLRIRKQGMRLYSHCLNVSIWGMAFAHYLGWNANKVQGFGLGSLIHDIGISRVPRAILDKPGPLTEEEMAQIREHVLEGYYAVQNLQLRLEALQMIRQHHENGDGSGYPEGLRLTAIHPWARVLRIVDSFEAMTTARPWRPAMDPKNALWNMRDDWDRKKIYDINLLKEFFKFLAGK